MSVDAAMVVGVTIGGAVACGSTPDASPWDGRAQELPCGVQPAQCVTGLAQAPLAEELTPSSPRLNLNLTPDEYLGASAAGCDLAYVYDLPPEKLSGLHLEINGSGSQSALGLEHCADYDATLHAYTRDFATADGFRLVDHRVFKAEASVRTGLCELSIQSAGPGEPDTPRNDSIWLTPTSYPAGLRLVVSALDACRPLPLRLSVAEDFASAGEPQPELPSQ
jgi:hypothetical protein